MGQLKKNDENVYLSALSGRRLLGMQKNSTKQDYKKYPLVIKDLQPYCYIYLLSKN